MGSDDSGREDDEIERWGRRFGRVLGYAVAGLLIINLFTHWFF